MPPAMPLCGIDAESVSVIAGTQASIMVSMNGAVTGPFTPE
jgi:hypothetical protein